MKAETRAVVLRVLNLEHFDPDASGHGGVLESVVDNALTDLKMLRTTCAVSDDRSLTSGELEHTLDGLIGRVEAGLEVARDIGREAKGASK